MTEANDQNVDYQAIKERLDTNSLTEADLDAIADTAVDFLRGVLGCFDENTCSIDEFEGDEGEIILNVTDGNFAVLIGRHGRCLEALQILLTSAMNRRLGFYYPVIVDIESYRSRRREKVIAMTHRAASRVRRTGQEVRLPVMNAYERRIVHIALREDEDLTTFSEGEDPERYVVVALAGNGATSGDYVDVGVDDGEGFGDVEDVDDLDDLDG